MKIINKRLTNTVLSFRNIKIAFDKEGVSEDVPSDIANKLLTLPYYEKVEEKVEQNEEKLRKVEQSGVDKKVDYNKLSVSELKKELDKDDIEYQANAKKSDLIKLLEK